MKALKNGGFGLASSFALGVGVLSLLAGCEGVLGGGTDREASSGSRASQDEAKDDRYGIIQYESGLAPTPLARLTNDEFLASAAVLLDVSPDAAPLAQAKSSLVAEPLIGGLNNDARTQLLKQLTLGSFSTIASATTDAFLEGVSDPEGLATRLDCDADAADDLSACTKAFGVALMERAFRRPLESSEAESLEGLIDKIDNLIAEKATEPSSLDSHILRVRSVVRYVLVSPDYLLLVEQGTTDSPEDVTSTRPLTSYEIASRMAYFLSGGPPDEELLSAAAADTLTDEAIRLEHVDRILNGSGGQQKVETAIVGWLGVNESAVDAADIATLSDFVGSWFRDGRPFADFYQAPIDVAHLDGSQTEEPFGVLGQPAFLESHTAFPTPAFITRGVFVVERLLCAALPADLPAEALEAGATSDLEVFQVHDQQPCASCHIYFDNFGAALHQFDAETGLYVPGPTELGSGFELEDPEGVIGVADNPADLGEVLGSSGLGQSCMAKLWYRSAKRRDLDPSGADDQNVEKLVSDWEATGDTSLKSLLRTIVASEDFVTLFP